MGSLEHPGTINNITRSDELHYGKISLKLSADSWNKTQTVNVQSKNHTETAPIQLPFK